MGIRLSYSAEQNNQQSELNGESPSKEGKSGPRALEGKGRVCSSGQETTGEERLLQQEQASADDFLVRDIWRQWKY